MTLINREEALARLNTPEAKELFKKIADKYEQGNGHQRLAIKAMLIARLLRSKTAEIEPHIAVDMVVKLLEMSKSVSEVELCKVFFDGLESFKDDLKNLGLSEEDADKAMCLFGAGLESIHDAAREKAIEANRHLANISETLIKKNPLPETSESHQA